MKITNKIASVHFNTFYLPTQVATGDSFQSITVNGKTAVVKFRDLALTECEQPISLTGTVIKRQIVKLPSKDSAQFLTLKNRGSNSQISVLSMHRGTCYIMISAPELSLHEVETIGAWLAPLNG